MSPKEIRMLEQLTSEFARVEKRSSIARNRSWQSGLSLMLVAVVLLAGAYAVPPTRAALEDVTGAFAGWVDGNDAQAPGRALHPGDDVPGWISTSPDKSRLIASADGVGLFVTRDDAAGEPFLNFSLGKDATIVGATVETWRERFDDETVVVLGTAPTSAGDELDDRGRFPLMGVVATSVDHVELRYATGAPLAAGALSGGFVLMADSKRPMREIVAFDRHGLEIGRASLDGIDAPSR